MRVAIVGGSSSIGREVVRVLASRGDQVLATWTHSPFEAPPQVQTVRLDLLEEANLAAFVEAAQEQGPLDAVLFLSALLPGKSLADYTPALMFEVMTVNLTAQARLIQLLLPRMAPQSQVLMMGSISGTQGSFDPIYAASKAALVGLVKSLARWHGKQVRFNCLAPSLVEGSAMAQAMVPERRRHHRENAPTGALLSLEDLARVIADLLGPHWRHLNGAVIPLDGGLSP